MFFDCLFLCVVFFFYLSIFVFDVLWYFCSIRILCVVEVLCVWCFRCCGRLDFGVFGDFLVC